MLQQVHFAFDDSPAFEGLTDGTRWNGFLNVRVTPATRDAIVAEFEAQAMRHDGDREDYVGGIDTIPVECGLVDLSGGFATTEATCECGHLSRDHQSGEGPWTGFCGGTLGTTRDYHDAPPDGVSPDEECSCEAFSYEGEQTR